jgi:hypothetical protein
MRIAACDKGGYGTRTGLIVLANEAPPDEFMTHAETAPSTAVLQHVPHTGRRGQYQGGIYASF